MRELKDYFETESLSESRKKGIERRIFYASQFSVVQRSGADDLLAEEGLSAAVETVSAGGSGGSFTYGSPSVLHMFYREPGTADELVRRMHESRDLYHKLTDKNGFGSDYILEAELEYNRGNFDRAEILSYKAFHLTSGQNQTGILVCSLFCVRESLCFGGYGTGIVSAERAERSCRRQPGVIFSSILRICAGLSFSLLSVRCPACPSGLKRGNSTVSAFIIPR